MVISEGFYYHGQTEPEGVPIVGEDELSDSEKATWRHRESTQPKVRTDVSIVGAGVDHGLGAHAANGRLWRTTPFIVVRLDYLKGKPLAFARLERNDPTELMAQLAKSIAIQNRGRFLR